MKFNLIITGVGGQGILTLGRIIAEAALLQGYDVKTSELHGLSQRGGYTEMHVRFGDKIHSPLVMQMDADLIISLELLESLRACQYGNKEKTIFLINNFKFPSISVYLKKITYPTIEKIKEILGKFSLKFEIVNATEIVKKKGASPVLSNIYLFGHAVKQKYLPIEKENALKALEKIIGLKKAELVLINKQIFEEAFKSIYRENFNNLSDKF